MNSYNGAAFIEAAIASVLAQSHGDFEFIVYDDRSTDGCVALAEAFGDPRMRVCVSPDHVPVGEARNRAIALARGEWIAFIDQDDLWTPIKLERQAALIDADRSGRLGIVYGATRRFGAGRPRPFDPWHGDGPKPEGDIFADLLDHPSFIALSSACLRTAAVRALGPIPDWVRLCPDYYLFVAIARDWLGRSVPDLCCHYRVHPQAMSQVGATDIHREALAIIEWAAGADHAAILRRRRRVAHTLIATGNLRAGNVRAGLSELFGQGSLTYFAGRPMFRFLRDYRNRMRPSP